MNYDCLYFITHPDIQTGTVIIEFSSLCYFAEFQAYKTHNFTHI